MGSQNSKESQIEYGEEIKLNCEQLIHHSEQVLSHNQNPNLSQGHRNILSSIQQDVDGLKKIISGGGEIKVGLVGRSSEQEKLVDILYLNPLHRGDKTPSSKANV